MLFKFAIDKLSGDKISINVHNVESLRWDRQGSRGSVTMTSGARRPIYQSDFDMLETIISRIPASV